MAEVDDIMSSLKVSSKDGDRKHLLPMSKDFMYKIMAWSMKECPRLNAVIHTLEQILDGMPASDAGLEMDLADCALIMCHLKWIIFDVMAWIVWAR